TYPTSVGTAELTRGHKVSKPFDVGPSQRRPTTLVAASTASASTRSFIGSSLWPFTQRNVTRFGPAARAFTRSTNGSQRSRLATGFFCEFSQPRFCQPSHQRSRKQLTT